MIVVSLMGRILGSVKIIFGFVFVYILFIDQAHCQSKSESCDLQNGHIVKLNQQLDEGSLQNKFSLQIDEKIYPALLSYKGVPDLAVTGEVQFSACINNVFMLIVDTGSVRQPGVAVRFNAKAKKVEKIYFAQNGLPRFIQSDDAFAVMFNYDDDYDEDAKFVRITYKESANNTFHQEYLKDINESGLIKIPEPN